MDGGDFLEVAERLSRAEDAGSHRSAVSRAYYAAYNALVEGLIASGVPKSELALDFSARKGDAHGQIESALRNMEFAAEANDLKNLRAYRIEADYFERGASNEDVRVSMPDALRKAKRLVPFASNRPGIAAAWLRHTTRMQAARGEPKRR